MCQYSIPCGGGVSVGGILCHSHGIKGLFFSQWVCVTDLVPDVALIHRINKDVAYLNLQ